MMESRMDMGEEVLPRVVEKDCKLADLLERYGDNVTPQKASADKERVRIKRLLSDPLSALSLKDLTGKQLASFRNRRAKTAPRACGLDLALLRHMLKIAKYEWGYTMSRDPFEGLTLPKPSKARSRRVSDDEVSELLTKAEGRYNVWIGPVIQFAAFTGMRRSEVLKVIWRDLDEANGLLTIRDTKNGEDRTIPLTEVALRVLESLPRASDRIFPITENAFRMAWQKLLKRTDIEDLHFHDLRHEAISRFFEMGLSVPEVQLISGHKTVTMLSRYTHMKPERVREKLRQAAG
jgi:integrase